MALSFDLGDIGDEQISKLMELLAASDVELCEIEQGDCKISLRRALSRATCKEDLLSEQSKSESAKDQQPAIIHAPAVGIFLTSEKHSEKPAIQVGDKVSVGDVVGFIQVMNVSHSIQSTHDGIVESILVSDGQPVEYGQPLISLLR